MSDAKTHRAGPPSEDAGGGAGEPAPGTVAGNGSYEAAGVELSTRDFLDGVAVTDITVFYQDTDLHYLWIENPAAGFETVRPGACDEDILPADAAGQLTTMKRGVLANGMGGYTLLEITPDEGATRWFDVWAEPDTDPEDRTRLRGLMGFAIEVTHRVEREERLRVLLREVSHRSRNLLAIVQSIASQTMQGNQQPHRFIERFNERLQSLAHTLDIVTLRDWEGATLQQLVSRQAGPFVSRSGVIEVSGVDAVLSPNAALHLGLAVQELASNAASHGVWSDGGGMVHVLTRFRTASDPNSDLVFEWREAADPNHLRAANDDGPSDGDPTAAPGGPFLVAQQGAGPRSGKRATFGSRTLMRIVPASVGGEAKVEREGDRFLYTLTVPASNFESIEGDGTSG